MKNIALIIGLFGWTSQINAQIPSSQFNCVNVDSLLLNEQELVCIKSDQHIIPILNSQGQDSILIYTPDGDLMTMTTVVYTLLPYSGCAINTINDNCILYENYKDGKKNGLTIEFFITGELKSSGNYLDNHPIGEHLLYSGPNQLCWRCNFDENGKEHGFCEVIDTVGKTTYLYNHGNLEHKKIEKRKKKRSIKRFF